jgi:3-methylcrotonyl-CoA carboxylase alpha subunit
MEAMKMEHTLHAPRDGVVGELLYRVGDQVSEGAELLRLEDA